MRGDDLVHVKTIEAYMRHALSELADVAQCMCNCLHAINPTINEWEDAVRSVQEHNRERGRKEIEHATTLEIDWKW